MDKSYHSSGDSSSNSSRDHYLKHLNKISHKISKPIRKNPFDHHHQHQQQQHLPNQQQQQQQQQNLQQQQHQPPVYNINKSDFRDVVQKLTGSPAHDRFSTPPPIHPPKPPSSRLQRIRPPPLAHVSNRPPPPLPNPIPPPPYFAVNNGRPTITPLSPLPPFPAVHAAAESPISAYMRYLQGSISASDPESKRFSPLAPLVSPQWNSFQPQQGLLPSSPLGFGRLPSPRSPYPLLSPSLLFSPSMGQLGFPQFPLSPRFSMPSPRWRDL
ncbi:hypothetical protein HHK36_003971 [Tetracentron sinense]|uniref:VQ domain-containing protein n=1 Tax=Tetracentron sinense TaxID=13715 RepID=A0A835DSZ8_TETSI|nr:hypothetical protein HHK36_003971 [Tetracentron sinense]